MLKEDITWPISRRFKSKTEWEPVGFFSECLCNSFRFDLMLGFFSSSAISVLADSFATFIANDGKMRLIINDILTDVDKNAISAGNSTLHIPAYDISDVKKLRDTLSTRDKHFFECLAWLIRSNRIDIRIISPIDGIGMSHTKCGVFYDNTNKVAFDGSVNFTRTALIDNIENMKASCSWDGEIGIAGIEEIAEDFENIFSGNNHDVKYIEVDRIKTSIVDCFGNKEIKDLLHDEYILLTNHEKENLRPSVRLALNKAKQKLEITIAAKAKIVHNDVVPVCIPRFPYPSGPREYQQIAFENWKSNGQKGLFAMATGTGKTITSLNCLLEIYLRKGYYKALILVPTITLVNQWEEECRKFNFINIIKVYSKNPFWKDEIDRITFEEKYAADKDIETSYIIITTYASFAREKVFNKLIVFDKKRLLLIADECHNMGSEHLINKLRDIPYLRRIGLSATPERQFDDNGNKQLVKFFGVGDKYTYEYSMEEAIQNGVLCRYMYFPHIVELTT